MTGSARPSAQQPAPAPGVAPGERLRFAHFTTAHAAPEHRHEAWAARGFPSISALYASVPIGPFDTATDWIRLDGMILQYATGTPRHLERNAARIGADGVAMLGVGIHFDGDTPGDAEGRPFHCAPGDVLFLDMARPNRLRVPSGRSIQLCIPYPRVASELGPPALLHGMVVPAARAVLFSEHLDRLHGQLPSLPASQEVRVARSIVDQLALALDQAVAIAISGVGEGAEPRASAARRAIERALGSRDLDAASLCEELGISRSNLYQEFRAEGGVQAYIRSRRLDRVRAALLDPDNRMRIADLAYRWGFADESHLSRQFRAAYGTPPSQYRRSAQAAGG